MSERSQKWTVLAMTFNIDFAPILFYGCIQGGQISLYDLFQYSHLSPIISVLSATISGCLVWTISYMNLLGFPRTTGFRPEAVATAATIEPVPEDFIMKKIRSKCKDCEEYEIPACVSKHVVYKKERELL